MNRRKTGEMSLFAVIFTLVLVCSMFPLFEYLSTYEQAQELRNKIQSDLDSFATATSINICDNIKQGKLKVETLDTNDFENQMGNSLGLTKDVSTWSSAKTNYSINNMAVQMKDTGQTIVLFSQYTLSIPVKLLGKTVAQQKIVQTAESYIAKKYYSANQKQDKYITGDYKDDQPQSKPEVSYNIAVSAQSGGTASVDKPVCKNTEICTVTAIPAQFKEFVDWENSYGIVVSTNPVYSFTPTRNISLTAVFKDALPDAPVVNLLSAIPAYDPDPTRLSSRINNISMKISSPAANSSLATQYKIEIYGLAGWPYSTLSGTAKDNFIIGHKVTYTFSQSGSQISSDYFSSPASSAAAQADGSKLFSFSSPSCLIGNLLPGRGYNYIAVAVYGATATVNGKADVKIYQVSGSGFVLANDYTNVGVQADGIGSWLYTK